MKHRAFTLIELLVVVAIIGILAAIGVNTFSGFQESAKSNTVKSNCKNVIKYIQAEVMKCSLGQNKAMDGNLNCNKFIADDVATACMDALAPSYKNIFDPQKDQRVGTYTAFFPNSLSNPCNSSDKGRISIRQHRNSTTLIIECCGDTNSNLLSETLLIETNG